MSVTDDWTETSPADGDNPKQGDDEMRNDRRRTRERLVRGGHYGVAASGADRAHEGKHQCGEATIGESSPNDGEFIIYESDGHAGNRTTAAVTIGDGAATPADTVTLGDGLTGSRPYTLVADTLKGKRIHDLAIPLPTSGTGRIDGVYYFNQGASEITIKAVNLYANSGPNGGALDVDIHLHTSGWTDLSSGGTTISSGGTNVISIADTTTGNPAKATEVTTFAAVWPGAGSDNTLATGEVLAFEVNTLSAAADIILFIRIERADE